jgi:hypothetical protein
MRAVAVADESEVATERLAVKKGDADGRGGFAIKWG